MKSLTYVFLTILALAGCGTLPEVRVGSQLESGTYAFRVKLEGKGQLFIEQKLKNPAKCESLRKAITVKVRNETESGPIATETSCTFVKGALVVHSKKILTKGDYAVEVEREKDRTKNYVDFPKVNARYKDPDFKSGTDYLADGAQTLDAGQTVKGSVSYAGGNATDWVRLKGKNQTVNLVFVEGEESEGLLAQVFDLPSGAKHPRLLGSLKHKTRSAFRLASDNLVVKVSAKGYAAKGEYSIVRSDSAGGRSVPIPVYDCYPVSETSSVVLLGKVEGIKVNDSVSVYGRKENGELVSVGNCQVSSIVGSQASCKMEGVARGYIGYSAEARI